MVAIVVVCLRVGWMGFAVALQFWDRGLLCVLVVETFHLVYDLGLL